MPLEVDLMAFKGGKEGGRVRGQGSESSWVSRDPPLPGGDPETGSGFALGVSEWVKKG